MKALAAFFAVFALANYVALIGEWVLVLANISGSRLGLVSLHTVFCAIFLWIMFQLLESAAPPFR